MDSLLGLWVIPYGGGDHICPGRHFVKHEILLTFAVLFTKCDVKLAFESPDAAARVRPDISTRRLGRSRSAECRSEFGASRVRTCEFRRAVKEVVEVEQKLCASDSHFSGAGK